MNDYDKLRQQILLSPDQTEDPVMLAHQLRQLSDSWPRLLQMAPADNLRLKSLLARIWTELDQAHEMAQRYG